VPNPLRVLIVEDSEDDAAVLLRALRRGGYEVRYRQVDSASALRASLDAEPWDIVISDYSMPGFSGSAALAILREKDMDLPFIFLSGTIGEETAVQAMKGGAQDYIMKGSLARLVPAIDRELREAENRRERRRAEQRMRQLEKFEVIGKLVGGIAHDFNNALGAIMGWAEIGKQDAAAGKDPAKSFQKIYEQSERAAALTRQLLAYARRQILERRTVNVNQTVKETMALLQKVIGEQIAVKFLPAPDLRMIRADPVQIEQVFINLCLNARDAMPKGGQLLIETTNVEFDRNDCQTRQDARPGRHVRLSVSDTGVGMDPATKERIFEPFFTTKDVGKGTGLGLAIVLGIVKQHDGSIEVYSEPGKGTVVHVYLPASDAAPEPRRQENDAPVRGGSETILIAEDHDGVREMAAETLRALGYRVILARDGEEAVGQFESNRDVVELILMDVVMPKTSGSDAYAKISAIRPGIPVIFTSGYSSEGAFLASMPAKGVLLLQKPYAPKMLARKVREVLDSLPGGNEPRAESRVARRGG
jgi:two-component system, cell cycle sensor histidine kinase and response regulator CckA